MSNKLTMKARFNLIFSQALLIQDALKNLPEAKFSEYLLTSMNKLLGIISILYSKVTIFIEL